MPDSHTNPNLALDPATIYDTIMQEIEPDLVSSRIPLLDEKYKDETPEEREVRMEHYDYANVLFDEALTEFAHLFAEDVKALKSQMQENVKPAGSLLVDIAALDSQHA